VDKTDLQYTDPVVTRLKYDRELDAFARLETDWRAKGVFKVRERFPQVEFIFTSAKLSPAAVVYCVQVDFTNYDTEPLSIRFIDPFTGARLTRGQIPINFWQVNVPQNFQPGMQLVPLDLLQGQQNEHPFMCIRGVREYHHHPAHTGDSWFLYRKRGEGTLGFILDQLYNYSIDLMQNYNIDFQFLIKYAQVPKVTLP
jgi:hypothetical protein